jgi:hypothetical protein
MREKYLKALEFFELMAGVIPKKRPNCEEIRKQKNLWSLAKEDVKIEGSLRNEISAKTATVRFTIYHILKQN